MNQSFEMYQSGFTPIPNLLLENYQKLKITSDEFVLITYLLAHANLKTGAFDFQVVTTQLGWTTDRLFTVISSLSNKDYLSIDLIKDQAGKQTDYYSLEPLFALLTKKPEQTVAKETKEASAKSLEVTDIRELIRVFEQEFGRGLSGMEIEMLNNWIHQDNYDLALIRIALREAVIHSAINIKYIDTILLNWQKENIQTAYEAERAILARRQRQQPRRDTNYQERAFNDPEYPEIPLPGFD